MTNSQQCWQLHTSYQWRVRPESHHQFVSTCLHCNTIPRGLQINTQPLLPKPPSPGKELFNHLEEEWTLITHHAATQLLKLLKNYHRKCAEHFSDKIEKRSRAWSFGSICHCQQRFRDTYASSTHELRETRKQKLDKLLPPRKLTLQSREDGESTIRHPQQKKQRTPDKLLR